MREPALGRGLLALIALLGPIVLLPVPAAQAGRPLTVVSWGGAYQRSQAQAYFQPYTRMTGDRIIAVPRAANGLAGLRAQVRADHVTWDLVDMLAEPARRACEQGLVEPIDHDRLLKPAPNGDPPSKDFIPALGRCFVPEILYSTVFAYNTRVFPDDAPDSIRDVWDTRRFPGKRALQKTPVGNLEWALMAAGVAPDRVYDVLRTDKGVQRAFDQLDKLRDDVVWWTQGAASPRYLADREVAIASGYNGRFTHARRREGQPIRIIWDGQLFEADGWVVPKGRLDDSVEQFLRFATDTQRLADQARYIAYGPARSSSVRLLRQRRGRGGEDGAMPTAPANMQTAIHKDIRFWARHRRSLGERFDAWLARADGGADDD